MMRTTPLYCVMFSLLALARAESDVAPLSAPYELARAQTVPRPVLPPPAPEQEPALAPLVLLPRTEWPRIELADGRVLENARAVSQDAANVVFAHGGGITKIDKRLLPAALAELFPLDRRAAAIERKQAEATRAFALREMRDREEAARRRAEIERERTSHVLSPVQREWAKSNARPVATQREVELAAKDHARRYFENEKKTGSGSNLVFDFNATLESVEEVPGWSNRWSVEGAAYYKVYDSKGTAFSGRSKKFAAYVQADEKGGLKVEDFTERY